jgi:hypothetical protein
MKRGWLFLTLVVALAAAVTAATAAASPPERVSGTLDLSLSLGRYCSFPIAIDAHVDYVTTNFFDSTHVRVRTQAHIHEQDVFSANGISLTGLPFSFTLDFYYAPDGTETKAKSVGVVEKIPLPSGKLYILAGYVDLFDLPPGQGDFILTVTHGNPGDADALCAALTP